MVVVERQREILDIIDNGKIISIKELADKFNVSEMTIRRDTRELNLAGFIEITSGRISKITKLTYDAFYGERLNLHRAEKERITDYALNYISNGNSIFMDGSTTCNYLIKKLSSFSGLTVITNSIINLKGLSIIEGIKIINIGGILGYEYLSIGEDSINQIKKFNTDIFFVGTSAIHTKIGFFESNIENSQIKKIMIENSKKIIIICDSSKIGKTNLVKFADINDIDVIITDININKNDLEILRNSKLEVILV